MSLTVISICAVCGAAIAAQAEICFACRIAESATAARAMAGEVAPPGTCARPLLTVRDFARLERHARLEMRPDGPLARDLLALLDEARLVSTGALPRGVAALGSHVIFSAGEAEPQARVLMLPGPRAQAAWALPVNSPHGLALLGRRAGAEVTVPGEEGAPPERLRLLTAVNSMPAAPAHA